MISIIHIITGLSTGGAEMMLYKLLGAMDRTRFRNMVISLTGTAELGGRIEALRVPVVALRMQPGRPPLSSLLQLAQLLRTHRPHIVQTWMYHANLLGGIAARCAGRIPVVWNIRRGHLEPAVDKRTTIWTSRLCAAISGLLPARIVCCSQSARASHAGAGYADANIAVIPNGFDLRSFRPDPRARTALRARLDIPADAPLIGLVARFDPAKDHETFLRAAGLLHARIPDARFLLCGQGATPDNLVLTSWVQAAGIRHRSKLVGRREDVPQIMAALDICVSSSVIEAFPNVVGEAMACGVPCVVTDAGDSRLIVGDTGVVVRPRCPEELANGMAAVLQLSPEARAGLGASARERVLRLFNLPDVAAAYQGLYEELSARCAA